MKVIIAGGTGFLGGKLTKSLRAEGHETIVLTRRTPSDASQIQWDGRTTAGWGHIVGEVDAVVQLTGYGLEHWPWTDRQKRRFADSRVLPALALASAIEKAPRRPRVFLSHSGINYYGLRGETAADEFSPRANDFLARLAAESEAASRTVEDLGVRRVVVRSAVVLALKEGLFPLMALPVRLFFGGRFGDGTQSFNWIHVVDHIRAIRFLLENEDARGAYNSIATQPTTNTEFLLAITATPTMRFGKEVLAGFDLFNLKENGSGELIPIEGDFAYGVGTAPMSSDPDSPYYRADWKDILYNGAPLTVEVIGNVAFGGVKADDIPEADDDTDGGEEPIPLPTS